MKNTNEFKAVKFMAKAMFEKNSLEFHNGLEVDLIIPIIEEMKNHFDTWKLDDVIGFIQESIQAFIDVEFEEMAHQENLEMKKKREGLHKPSLIVVVMDSKGKKFCTIPIFDGEVRQKLIVESAKEDKESFITMVDGVIFIKKVEK